MWEWKPKFHVVDLTLLSLVAQSSALSFLSISSSHNALALPHHLYKEYNPYTDRDSLEPRYRYPLPLFQRLGPDRCLRGKRLIFSASHPPSGFDGKSPPTTGVSRRSAFASWAPCWSSSSSQWPYANAAITSQDHCSALGLAERERVVGHRYLHHHFHSSCLRYELNFCLGTVSELQGDPDGALFAYEQALRHNYQSIQALNAISCILRTKENFPRAVEYLQTILKLDQSNGEVWGSLGSYRRNVRTAQDI